MSATTPAVGAQNVALDAAISCEVYIPNGGIDAATLTSETVYLKRANGLERIPAQLNTTGGGDAIVLRPLSKLEPKVSYTFFVTSGLKDVTGASFTAFQMTIKTGTTSANTIDKAFKNIKFDRVAMDNTAVARFLGVTIGPDHKLYAGTDDGRIFRYPINDDETLGTPDIIDTIRTATGTSRFVVGIAFDPASTVDNVILWVSHTASGVIGAADWTGTISQLSGPNLDTIKDVVVHLPRSYRDHVTGQLAFGPDGALYFGQPSNSAMGAPDAAWGNRPEHLLTAAILRLDVAAVAGRTTPLDVKTRDGGGTYDPYAAGAPLTIYASGVRNAYDVLWGSNGQLYASVNGSAAGGTTPASPDGKVPGIPSVSVPAFDALFRVLPNRYYGHPNPQRNEYVLNGGNPTAAADPFEISDYPVGVTPPSTWRGGVFNFGLHQSPDGMTEYKGNAFGGALQGSLLVCEYSAGDDIVILQPSSDHLGILKSQSGLPSLSGFRDPLDVTEDQHTGNLYVLEYSASTKTSRITLLKVPADQRDPNAPAIPTPTPVPVPTPTPTPVPTPIPTPTPPPVGQPPGGVPIVRTNKELKIIFQIDSLASRSGLAAPDLTTTPGNQLKSILADTKVKSTILIYAAKQGLAAPDLSQASGTGLKGIYAGLKLEVKRRAYQAKVVALAAKMQYPLPELNSLDLAQLKALRLTISHAGKASR